MESRLLVIIIILLVLSLSDRACSMLETPPFTLLISKPDIQIRLYQGSSWLSSPVQGNSFDMATKQGFHRIYQYMKGANQNSVTLNFTAPILTSINSKTSGGLEEYTVMFYLPKEYRNSPPLPNPNLNLHFTKWPSYCIAVHKFTGYAKDDNIATEKASLVNSLNDLVRIDNHTTISEKDLLTFAVAQYTSPFKATDRINEVWLIVSHRLVNECPLSYPFLCQH